MKHYPPHLLKLIAALRQLPGVGEKTAERYAFHLLAWSKDKIKNLSTCIEGALVALRHCSVCGALNGEEACPFCDLSQRQSEQICIVSSDKDVFAIEETGSFNGLYHVLGGLLSPIDGYNADRLRVESLKKRIAEQGIQEVILALDSTLDGDTTALYLRQELGQIQVTRPAFGLPMGSPLEYVDGGTLSQALEGRRSF